MAKRNCRDMTARTQQRQDASLRALPTATSDMLDELWDAKRTAEYLGTTESVLARERQECRGLTYVVIG